MSLNFAIIFTTTLIITSMLLYLYLLKTYLVEKPNFYFLKLYSNLQLALHLAFLPILLIMISYLFHMRYKRMSFQFNLKIFLDVVYEEFFYYPLTIRIAIVIISILCMLLWSFIIRIIHGKIKNVFLRIHTYFVLNKIYDDLCSKYLNFVFNFGRLIIVIVEKCFNQNIALKFGYTIKHIIRTLWNFLFRYTLLYVLLYDYVINFGLISKFFVLVPWFFILGLTRLFLIFLHKTALDVNFIDLSIAYYPSTKTYPHWE